jgi:hypothetical protein
MILENLLLFSQSSSSLSGSISRLLLSAKWKLAALPPPDSLLTNGCTFISQQIRNRICITLAIYGICIMIKKLNVGKYSMYIHLSGWCTFYFSAVAFLTTTRWRRSCSGRMGCWLWWQFTRAFAPPVFLPIHCSAIMGSMAGVRMIFTNQCWVTFLRSHDLAMPRKLNSSFLLFLDFSARCLDYLFRFFYCIA